MPNSRVSRRSTLIAAAGLPRLALATAVVGASCLAFPTAAVAVSAPTVSNGTTSGPEIKVPGGEQRVTMRLRQMEIGEALRLIAARAKLSFSISQGVIGKVDFDFYNERLNRILEIVLTTNGLHMYQVGSSYVVSASASAGLGGIRVFQLNYGDATQVKTTVVGALKASGIGQSKGVDTVPVDQLVTADARSNTLVVSGNQYFLDQVSKLIARLDKPHDNRVFRLNYIQAADAEKVLKDGLFNSTSSSGIKVIQVGRDNSIMVMGSPEDLSLAAQILEKVDKKLRQVLVEVKIIEVAGGTQNALGVTFDSKTGTLSGGYDGTGVNVGYNPMQASMTQISAKINALVATNKVRMLASPTLLTMDSQESTLDITERIITRMVTVVQPQAVGQAIVTRNPELGDAGIKLTIRPRITPDGYITMKVSPEISSPGRTVEGTTPGDIIATLPTKRTLTTPEVRVRNGEALIIGGLNQERVTENENKVPILGDIPYLGVLFSKTSRNVDTTELVLMITPKIVPEGEVPKASSN